MAGASGDSSSRATLAGGSAGQQGRSGQGRGMQSPFGAVATEPAANGLQRNSSGGPSYSRQQLIDIYEDMLLHSKVRAPSNVTVPPVLQKTDSSVSWQDLQVDKWVYFDAQNGCRGPVPRAELLDLWEDGNLPDETIVVPLGLLVSSSGTMAQMMQIWTETTKRELGGRGSGDSGTVRVGSQEKGVDMGADRGAEAGSVSKAAGVPGKEQVRMGRRIRDEDIEADRWLYMDMQACEQGPFSWSQLEDWWLQNFLDQELPVRPESWEPGQFVPMRLLLAAVFAGDEEWVYRDEQGLLQGPFAKEQILAWWEAGYMPANLPTRPASWEKTDDFLTLIQFLVKWKGVSDGWLYKDTLDATRGPVSPATILEKVKGGELVAMSSVKPDSWEGDVFVPLQHLLDAL